jgi:hypothetical protein
VQQWEYLSMVVTHREDGVRLDGQRVESESAVAERLAALGKDGWELVAVTALATDYRTPVTHGMAPTGSQDRYVFKRPIPGPKPKAKPDPWADLRALWLAQATEAAGTRDEPSTDL